MEAKKGEVADAPPSAATTPKEERELCAMCGEVMEPGSDTVVVHGMKIHRTVKCVKTLRARSVAGDKPSPTE